MNTNYFKNTLRILLLAGTVLVQIQTSTAQTPYLVKDIEVGTGASFPEALTDINGTLYFTAQELFGSGRELWKSDGTSGGTVMVKDIVPGTASGFGGGFDPHFTYCNGFTFFIADDGVHGYELWKTDGSAAGTMMVKDIRTGADGGLTSDPEFTVLNNTLIFTAYDDTNGGELWKSDGTSAGTVLLKDIYPGIDPSYPYGLTYFNGYVYFAANDPNYGYELWRTDGTTSGTQLFKDIGPGPGLNGGGSFLTAGGGKLYFAADDGTNGQELWVSDGTSAGTHMIKDIYPGSFGSNPNNLYYMNGKLYFGAESDLTAAELWSSDGTGAGTSMVKEITPGIIGSYPSNLINVNNTLFFNAYTLAEGSELWKTDGTDSGTVMVKDILPGNQSGLNTSVPFCAFSYWVYFLANDGPNGTELWRSDGTASNTTMIDIWPGNFPAFINNSYVVSSGNHLFMNANDGQYGIELWSLNLPVGIHEMNSANSTLNVYPNPATNIIKLPGATMYSKLRAINLLGQEWDLRVLANERIDISMLPAGIYSISATESNGKTNYSKMVKQ